MMDTNPCTIETMTREPGHNPSVNCKLGMDDTNNVITVVYVCGNMTRVNLIIRGCHDRTCTGVPTTWCIAFSSQFASAYHLSMLYTALPHPYLYRRGRHTQ